MATDKDIKPRIEKSREVLYRPGPMEKKLRDSGDAYEAAIADAIAGGVRLNRGLVVGFPVQSGPPLQLRRMYPDEVQGELDLPENLGLAAEAELVFKEDLGLKGDIDPRKVSYYEFKPAK